ncbi:MAG: FecR domain-containing protein [Gammaproteobacteria bacterium]
MSQAQHTFARVFGGLLVWMACASPVLAAAPESVGQVIVARGAVHAQAPGGESRPLQRRSPVYAGDVVRTAAASEVQLRFTDGALLALRADTEFRIDEYRFADPGGAGDRSVSTLIKGGLRTITGAIGKQDPQAYQVNTPVATIGVRGTHYEAVLESPKSLVLAAWQGAIQVRNDQGVIALGVGAAHNFGRAQAQQRPRGLLRPPAALQVEIPVGQAESTDPQTAQAGETAPTEAGSSSEVADLGGASETASAETTVAALGGPLGLLGDGVCSTCTPPQQIVVNAPADLLAATDLRFTATEWTALQATPYLGIAVEAEDTVFFGFDGGRVLYHGSDSPVFTDNGYGPHEPEYATAPILDVVRRGKASVDAFGSHVVDAAHTVYWGTWNGTVNPIEIQTDANDPGVIEPMYSPYHWLTLLPTDQAVMAARTGSVNYNNVVFAHGGGSGGGPLTPANLSFNADVNFDTGAVSNAYLGISNGPETWNVNFNGQVRGNVLDIKVDTLTSTVLVTPNPSQAVEGDIGMVFTGSSGQVIGGGFMFQEHGNPARHVEGTLLVQ